MINIQKIKKRTGEIVDFDPAKINTAIKKAFLSVTGNEHEKDSAEVTESIVKDLDELFVEREDAPSVEVIQDLVEKEIMKKGYFAVAKSYIIYRYEHSKEREEAKLDVIEKIEEGQLAVVKRSGKREAFSIDKLEKTLAYAAKGVQNEIDIHEIAVQCQAEIYDGVTSQDISRALIMVTRSMIEKDPAYSIVGSRLLLADMYKETIGVEELDFDQLKEQHSAAFIKNIKRGINIGRLDKRLLNFNLKELSDHLDLERDELLRYMGTQTLHDRYVVKDLDTKEALETPQFMWMRVAMGLAINEEHKDRRAKEFYDVISLLQFIPSTPTLFHAGTERPQLSSCYLNTVTDSLDHIFKVYGDNAQLSKWSGGIGTDWTAVRGTGSRIKGTGVDSQGVIPFLKIANDATVAINRSGRRRGAACVYLEVWHYDIESFLELRKNTGDERRRTHDLNTATWIPDLFMKRVRDDGTWTLFSPDETPDLHDIYGKKFEDAYQEYENKARSGDIRLQKVMKARDLWKKMINMLFETGHPWVTFKDPSNVRSPQDHVGVVHNSNLCTEITLNTSKDETAVCNLGSVNYAMHVVNGSFDENLIGKTVTTAMRMLDNVVDVNFYPTKEAETSNLRHRPVGMGIMGLQDALYKLKINFDSDQGVEFSDSSQELVSYYAVMASAKLAEEKGAYPSFKGSKWDRGILPADTIDLLEKERGEKIELPRAGKLDWTPVREAIKKHGMRNSNCLAIAPTATISNIAGSFPTIEPIYKNIYVKANQAGDFTVVNPYLIEELKSLKLWDFEMLGKLKYNDGSIQKIQEIPQELRDRYKEVFEINARWLIKAAAYRGRWIDQSQSLNIFYSGTSGKDLSEFYQYAWTLGLKTTYYLRSLAASQVEKSTVNTTEYGATHRRNDGKKKEIVAKPRPVVSVPQSLPARPLVKKVEPALASTADLKPMDGPGAAIAAPVKLCRIDDPDCESCQ